MRVVLRTVDPTAEQAIDAADSKSIKERVDRAFELIQESGAPKFEPDALQMLKRSIAQLQLSMRSLDRIAKVGRSIAALDSREEVGPADIAEALNYRITDANS